MFYYRAYGMVIRSAVSLPELDPCDPTSTPDAIIELGVIPPRDVPLGPMLKVETDDDGVFLQLDFIGRLRVEAAKRIAIDPRPGLELGLSNMAILGPALAVLLSQRNLFTLHGSAVQIGPDVHVFVGDKGAGKSTLAGALVARGHRLLADDIAAIDLSRGAQLIPGFPQLKLSFEAYAAFDIPHTEIIPTAIPDFPKHRLKLCGAFDHTPAHIAGVHVLARGEGCKAERVAGPTAFRSLLSYSYDVRFGAAFLHGPTLTRHLDACAALSRRAPLYQLQVPERLDALGACVEDLLLGLTADPIAGGDADPALA